jgi:hypothetical protein
VTIKGYGPRFPRLRLTLLAPEIIEAILNGHQSSALQLNDLLKPLPAIWAKQRSQAGVEKSKATRRPFNWIG